MAKDTVQAIRVAELRASRIEEQAAEEYEAVISKARDEAGRLFDSMKADALAKAEKELTAAEEKSKGMLKEATENAENAINELRELSRKNEAVAIESLLVELI